MHFTILSLNPKNRNIYPRSARSPKASSCPLFPPIKMDNLHYKKKEIKLDDLLHVVYCVCVFCKKCGLLTNLYICR